VLREILPEGFTVQQDGSRLTVRGRRQYSNVRGDMSAGGAFGLRLPLPMVLRLKL
jgi:hypothetical protein